MCCAVLCCVLLQFTLNSYPKEDLPDPTLDDLRRSAQQKTYSICLTDNNTALAVVGNMHVPVL